MDTRIRLLVSLTLVLVPGLVRADLVKLRNGEVFEGVVSTVDDGAIRIELAYGKLRLPLSSVLSVEKEATALESFFERREALRGEPPGSARDWLRLARWALGRGLDHGAREAALEAATLEPELEGLGPLMRRWGYGLDTELGVWVKARPRSAARPPASAAPPEAPTGPGVEQHLARAVEKMAEADLERARTERARADRAEVEERSRVQPQPAALAPAYPVLPVYYPLAAGGWVFPADPVPVPVPVDTSRHGPVVRNPSNRFARDLLGRVPGSLIPIGGPRSVQRP